MTSGTRIVTLTLRLALAATALAGPAGLPDLSGTWRLNEALSDDPAKIMRESRETGDTAGTWSGRGRGRGRGAGGRSGEESRPDPDYFASRKTLEIRHREPQLSIVDAAGRERTVYTDGRKTEEERSFGGTAKSKAAWKEGHIEVESTPEHGPRTVETYAIAADRSQLTVTTRLDGGRRSVTIRQVYDALPAPTPSPGPSGGIEASDVVEAGGAFGCGGRAATGSREFSKEPGPGSGL